MTTVAVEKAVREQAESLGHALSLFSSEECRRARCIQCGMTWDLRFSPGGEIFWVVTRRVHVGTKVVKPMTFGGLPSVCDPAGELEGVFSFTIFSRQLAA